MKSFLVKAFALNFVKKLNSFMTDVLSYRNQSNDLKSKSMEWFLYDRHSLMKELRSLKNPIKGKRITNYVLLWNFCLSFTIWLEISFWQKCWYQHNWKGVTHDLYVFWIRFVGLKGKFIIVPQNLMFLEILTPQTYSEPSQTSNMELSERIVNEWKPLSDFA